MVELNEKALEAAWYAGREARGMRRAPPDEAGLRGLRDAISAYLSALPAPDDGLVERLKAGSIALKNDRPASSTIMEEAATALQSKDAELQHLRADAENPNKGMWTFWNEKARELSEQIERWRQNSIDTWSAVFAEIERLTRERDVALENYTRAWNERDAQRRRAVAAEQQVQKLTAENERLRKAVLSIATGGLAASDAAYVAAVALETQEGGK